MALKKPTPKFEEAEVVTADANATAKEEVAETTAAAPAAQGVVDEQSSGAPAEQAAPAAKAETQSESKAVAVRPAASVSTNVKKPKYQVAYADFENVIDPTTVEFNTFKRITVSLDGFEDDQKADLGKEIHLDLMSFNSRWVVSPGTQDAEATELVRYSADGKTIDQTGEDVQEYLQNLIKIEGYKDASVKQYLSVYGFLTYANGAPIDAIDRSLVCVQVPPQSRALFDRFRIETGFKVAAGVMEETSEIVLTQSKQQGKTAKFAVINFSRA